MEDPYLVENIDRLGVLMFQTSDTRAVGRYENPGVPVVIRWA